MRRELKDARMLMHFCSLTVRDLGGFQIDEAEVRVLP